MDTTTLRTPCAAIMEIGLEIERAEGCWLYAADGRRYLDFISGIGVANLGHGHPAVLAAIEAAERELKAES